MGAMVARAAHTPSGPVPSSAAVRRRFQQQPSRNTQVEVAFRSILHRRGWRYRIHRRPVKGLRRIADVVLSPSKVAVFVDGCFWHGCSEHLMWPKSNAEWWREKITSNQWRDGETDRHLAQAGWISFRVWEHENLHQAVDRLDAVLQSRLGSPR